MGVYRYNTHTEYIYTCIICVCDMYIVIGVTNPLVTTALVVVHDLESNVPGTTTPKS